jgi:hypothetical protein
MYKIGLMLYLMCSIVLLVVLATIKLKLAELENFKTHQDERLMLLEDELLYDIDHHFNRTHR